jgi:hypothetical protein
VIELGEVEAEATRQNVGYAAEKYLRKRAAAYELSHAGEMS